MTGAESPPLEGRCILVVEDELLVAMGYEALLQEHGCDVLGPAATVARALALLETRRPDACLLDLNLGGHPATGVAEALAGRGVPFILVTGNRETPETPPVLKGVPRLVKPAKGTTIVDALAAALLAS